MADRQAGLDGPTFPGDQAVEFVREFRAAVAPRYENRAKLGTSPPLFLLRVPQASYRSGVDRVVAALTGALRQQVPFAHLTAETCADAGSVWADPDSCLLSADAGVQLSRNAPEHMTPEPFPQCDVMCGLIEYIRSDPGEWATTDDMEAALRRDAGERRAEWGGLLAFTRMQDPYAGGGIAGFLAKRSWLSFVQLLPRWLWARRISRTVARSWLGAERVAQGSKNLFRVLDQVAAVRSVQLMDDPADEEALQEFDWLVLRALLEDLRRSVIGRILPGRRRWACRPVLFVKIPPAGESGARAAERFLRSLYRAQGTARPPGPLVIAVGVPSDTLLEELGNPSESTFPDASVRLADHASAGDPPVLVTISEGALSARGVPVSSVTTRTFRFSWGVRRAVKAEQRSRKGVGEEPPPSRRDAWVAMRRAAISMGQGKDSEGRRHWQALAVVGLGIAVMLAAASISVRELLESFQLHGRLGPSDTPAVVTAIVALATATGTLIGVILTAFAKYVQARGQAEADLIRARAEMMRAEADVTRARAGLPPVVPSANGDSPASTSSTEPDTSELPPSGGGT